MSIGTNDPNLQNALNTAQQFVKSVRNTLFSVMSYVDAGKWDKSYTQTGLDFGLGNSATAGASVTLDPTIMNAYGGVFPRNYNIGSMTPTANVIIKKRLFTTLAYDNDTRFMDSFEKAFIRTSKSLFQLKAFQIATYEALTKFETILQQDRTLYIPSVITAIQNANSFGALTDNEANTFQSVLGLISQRDLAGIDTNFTTWYINQLDMDLSNIGRGVGVLELTNFTKIDTSNRIEGEGSANIEFEDPYHILLISNDDIESAINGAVFNNFTSTLLPALATDDLHNLSDSLQSQLNSNNPVVEAQVAAAINTVQQTATDALNTPFLSPEVVSFVRKKMRKFYLGKAAIQPTDGLHIFMRSDAIYENDQDAVGLSLGLDRFGVDEEILRQEMYVVTRDRNFDINLYKTLRDKNAFSGASVFTGVVENVSDNYSDGFYTLSVKAQNNLWYLNQSFVNTQPAIDQSQGFLHDPLTPYDFEFDSFGNIKTTDNNGNAGFKLSQDNIDRLSQINIKYDNGILRGNNVTAENVVTSTVPGTGIQQTNHFPGMVYKWKEGIAAISQTIGTSDPTGLFFNASREVANNTYGLSVTTTPFDNMDAANVVSLLVTGQPHNLSTFINNSVTLTALNSFGSKGSADSSYFGTFFNAVQRQNRVLGNFQPLLNGDSVSIDTLKKLAYKKISFNAIDSRIGDLETQIFDAQQKLNNLAANIVGGDATLLTETRQGLQAKITALQTEENALIQQFAQVSSDIQTFSNNQDALGFSTDPNEREAQIQDFQFRQLYVASKRIEDVRYNRDINYFIVGTEYDTDYDIQAFQANMRSGFNLFRNQYDPAIETARQAALSIDFEFFADASGNIRFRPPQYNKIPLSVYYELFRKQSQQGIQIIPDFVQSMFVSNISGTYENIVELNWQMLIALGKSGNDQIINALNASISNSSQKITEFLGYNGNSDGIVSDGNLTDELIEFNNADQVKINRANPPSSLQATNNILTLNVLQSIATQLEKRFGAARTTITQDDIIADTDTAAITKRKSLFNELRQLSSSRNSYIKSYLSQLNKLGIDPSSISSSGTSQNTTKQVQQQVSSAVQAQQNQLMSEVFQIASTGDIQGYARPSISSEFANLIEDDSRNYIGRGSGRRFVIRDDSIKSFRIEESQPDYCRINVEGGLNFNDAGSLLEGRWLWAGAVDYDLWRMYGFKTGTDKKTPYLSDPQSQLKPYAVFLLLKQHRKVMKGSITLVGNEYYQLGDVVYLADRDMIFYVTGISQNYSEGDDFTTTLTIEYGRPPGEYIPTPLDAIGKTLLKQGASSVNVTHRQMTPDTFYAPLRPTPALYLGSISSNTDESVMRMLNTDNNQGRLINALMNAGLALQNINAILVISGFKTGSFNDADIQSRLDTVSSWFKNPKILTTTDNGQNTVDFSDYAAIPENKIITKIIDMTTGEATQPSQNDVIASDSSIINTVGDPDLDAGILTACQEIYALINDTDDMQNQIPLIVEIGIFYKAAK